MFTKPFPVLFLLVFILAAVMPFHAVAAEPCLKFTLPPGPYAVGFKTINQYDYSRTYFIDYNSDGDEVIEKARPIQTYIWYPADKEKSKDKTKMIVQDYLDLLPNETDFSELSPEKKRSSLEVYYIGWDLQRVKATAEIVTNAVWEASPAVGSFPIIVYAPSLNAAAIENSFLCEYLAGHGYIVVASSSLGRYSGGMTVDPIGSEMQSRDISFLIGSMQNFPNSDYKKVTVIGFSWGGMAAVLTAMKDDRVKALVSLDGSTKYNYELFKKSIFADPNRLTMPCLFMSSKQYSDEYLKKRNWPRLPNEFLLYDEMKYGDAYQVQFNNFIHQNFSSWMILIYERYPEFAENNQEEVNQSYNLMCFHVLSFLNAYLKNDVAAMKYMTDEPKVAGIAEGLITKTYKKGTVPPPTFGWFLHQVKTVGFDKIADVYARVLKDFPQYELDIDSLINFGLSQAFEKKFAGALAVFTFCTETFPDYATGFYCLGEYYSIKGDKAAALDAYKKALALQKGFDQLGIAKKIAELEK